MLVRLSLFSHSEDSYPKPVEIAWSDLVSELSSHKYYPNSEKTAVPALSPTEFEEGATRSKVSARQIWFGAMDYDKLTRAEMDGVLDATAGLACLLYTTWSHPERLRRLGLWSFRLFMPFTRPVGASEWDVFWPRFDARFGALADLKCRHAAAIYFAPSAQQPSEHDFTSAQDGAPLDVDRVLAMPEPAPRTEDKPRVVGVEDLLDLAGRLVRRPYAAFKAVASAVRRAMKGEAFAEPGARDDIMFRIAARVAEEWPDADPGLLASLFANSLEAMATAAPECPTVEDFAEKIYRQQQVERERIVERDQSKRNALACRIRDAFHGMREDPYSDEELDSFAEAAGVSREAFVRRWVIQISGGYYLYKAGSYGAPIIKDDFVITADRDLAPASSAGVEVWKMSDDGDLRPKAPQELVLQYGTAAERVVVRFSAQKSYYDFSTGTLVEAPCPLRHLEPEFSRSVEEWLVALGGDNAGRLLDWIAVVARLDEPCAAIYLDGEPGSGKTLFADALSRLWTTRGPTPLSEVVGPFNDYVLGCPLVLADEVLPDILKKSEGTGSLRQLVQARQLPLSRKYKPTATLEGCLRIVLTSNNSTMLETKEHLTPDDATAIMERILYIRAEKEAREVLEHLGEAAVRGFVKDDAVAKHALWLRDTRQVVRSGRFLVSGNDSDLHRSLITSRGLTSAICNWCVSYLLEPGRMDATGTLAARVYQSMLHIRITALAEQWKMYLTNWDPPTPGQVNNAIRGIVRDRDSRVLTAGNGQKARYRVIRTDVLVTWAKGVDWCTEEAILEALATDTER